MGMFISNIGWKLLSLVVAFGLWLLVMSSNSIEVTKEVELNLELPPGLMVANDVPTKVSFRLQGSKLFLKTLANNLDTIQVNLGQAKAGPVYYRIERDSLRLPIGIKILSISPSSINPILEPVLSREIPVQVAANANPPPGYRLVKLQAVPAHVQIKGPKSQVERISALKAPAIELGEVPSSLRWEVPLSPPTPQVVFDEAEAPHVLVEVEPTGSNFRVGGVAVTVSGGKRTSVIPEKVALYVNCPTNQLAKLTPDKVKAVVHAEGLAAGTYLRDIHVDLPAGVHLVKIVPDRIQVRVE